MRREWVALAVFAAGAMSEVPLGGLELVGEAEAAAPSAAPLDVPYQSLVQRSIHNAYGRREPLVDQVLWHGVRSLELDVHTARAGQAAAPGAWWVFHEDMPLARESSCTTLEACLGVLAAFHRAAPDHDVVTLFLDAKAPFAAGHAPADLDAAVLRTLGEDAVVRPRDLLARCPGASSLRDAVAGKCTSPKAHELRGRFVVVLTGGTACDAASPVASYAAGSSADAALFVAPNANASCPVETLDAPSQGHVAFVNLSFEERARAMAVRARGLVARVYGGGLVGGLDAAVDFEEARRAGAQLLATDAVNAEVDAWAIPRGPGAAPRLAAGERDLASFAVVQAESGELAGERDSAFFAHERRETDAPETWSALVSVPSSHVDPEAKGCLMARASEDSDASFAAVCRAFDEGPTELLLRSRRGAKVESRHVELDRRDHSAESDAFLRLAVDGTTTLPRGLVVTHVIAEASADGAAWHVVGAGSIAGELPLRGVAVAAHGGAPVRALVGHLARSAPGETPVELDVTALPRAVGVGARARGAVRAIAR